MFHALVDAVKWLFANIIYLFAAIGIAAVVVRSVDDAVEKAMVRWPKSKFWKRLDQALDGGNAFLTWVDDMLHKIALRKPQ